MYFNILLDVVFAVCQAVVIGYKVRQCGWQTPGVSADSGVADVLVFVPKSDTAGNTSHSVGSVVFVGVPSVSHRVLGQSSWESTCPARRRPTHCCAGSLICAITDAQVPELSAFLLLSIFPQIGLVGFLSFGQSIALPLELLSGIPVMLVLVRVAAPHFVDGHLQLTSPCLQNSCLKLW